MFRRKDEAYDTHDLLQDVMGGIEDEDELLESSSDKKPAEPANNNDATASIKPSSDNSSSQKGASIMDSTFSSNTSAAPSAAAPSSNPSSAAAAAAAAMTAPAKPAPAAAFRPQASRAGLPATSDTSSNLPAEASAPKASKRVLTVGHDIHMKGEISTCDRLVIEGSVDASLSDVHTVEIAQTGSFKGTAEIEDAEISGSFEGDLIVNGRLTIYASGRVSGNVAYGEIEIERGGKLTGTIKTADEMKSSQGHSAKKAA